jgi:hypothetical protein
MVTMSTEDENQTESHALNDASLLTAKSLRPMTYLRKPSLGGYGDNVFFATLIPSYLQLIRVLSVHEFRFGCFALLQVALC